MGGQPQGQPAAHPDGLHPKARSERQRTMEQARLDVISSDDPLRDGDERRLAEHLGRHYPLTILDPGATGLTRLLRITDQLVIVAPASVEAASALADTRDWLDAHGFAELADALGDPGERGQPAEPRRRGGGRSRRPGPLPRHRPGAVG